MIINETNISGMAVLKNKLLPNCRFLGMNCFLDGKNGNMQGNF